MPGQGAKIAGFTPVRYEVFRLLKNSFLPTRGYIICYFCGAHPRHVEARPHFPSQITTLIEFTYCNLGRWRVTCRRRPHVQYQNRVSSLFSRDVTILPRTSW